MKKILFVVLSLSLNNQIAFGMSLPTKEIFYQETPDWKRYYATFYNGDFVAAYLFLTGPMRGKIQCSCITAKDSLGLHGFKLPNNNLYYQLEKAYKSQSTPYQ